MSEAEKALDEMTEGRDHYQAKARKYMEANTKLVAALDRVRDVLRGDEYMQHADMGFEQIVNEALAANNAALAARPGEKT